MLKQQLPKFKVVLDKKKNLIKYLYLHLKGSAIFQWDVWTFPRWNKEQQNIASSFYYSLVPQEILNTIRPEKESKGIKIEKKEIKLTPSIDLFLGPWKT